MSGVSSGASASKVFSWVLRASSVSISAFMLSWNMPALIASMMPRICFSIFTSSAFEASPLERRSRFSGFVSSA
ncbi:hypothetical protein [Agrobacterium sp.]|uniref:hypothetical protein n=1 Tax=Agrobacterium sp. TaxID=361 RepID=UPI0028A5E47A